MKSNQHDIDDEHYRQFQSNVKTTMTAENVRDFSNFILISRLKLLDKIKDAQEISIINDDLGRRKILIMGLIA